MAETCYAAANKLGVHLESADGSEFISGHTLNVTGAQGLVRLGLDLWAIQLVCRLGARKPLRATCDWYLSGKLPTKRPTLPVLVGSLP